MENKVNVILTVGLPGQGKTTYLQQNADEICAIYGINNRLSSDDMIETTAQELGVTYTDIFQDAIGFANSFVEGMVSLLSKYRRNFIIDRTNLSKHAREVMLKRLNNKNDYNKIAVVFDDVDMNELRRRLNEREALEGKAIPEELIQQMQARYQYPSLAEGFDSVLTVTEFHKTLPQINNGTFGQVQFS